MPLKEPFTKTSFADNQFKQTLSSHRQILKTYKEKIEDVLNLSIDLPIFLDTSVILSVYEISFSAREKIKQFLLSKKKNIVLTQQVQFEFVKNREKVINTFQSDVTEQIPTSFKSEVQNKLTAFKNNNKSKLEDYQILQERLQELENQVNALHEDIIKTVNDKKGTAISLLLEDDFLDILSETQLLDPLDQKHLTQIQEEYKRLLPDYKSSNSDNYTINSFPGCAEKGDKDDPTGDYIIFHEMMEYALEKSTDVIFLTNDTTKGDWTRKDGKPHFHYIENFFLNTKQTIYILNAERLFEQLFETSFESLIQSEPSLTVKIDETSLLSFLNSYSPFCEKLSPLNSKQIELRFVKELALNGFFTLKELKEKLDLVSDAIDLVLTENPNFGKIGLLRGCLKLLDPNYQQINTSGSISNNWPKYEALRLVWLRKKLGDS